MMIPPLLSSSDFLLVLRPDIGSDDHLMPIHESPWTPDGKVWFQAKISLLQVAPTANTEAATATATATPGRLSGGHINWDGAHGGERATGGGAGIALHGREYRGANADEKASEELSDQEIGGGAGLSVTLRPEGAGQRKARLEREAVVTMALEDERSRRVSQGDSRLYKEAAERVGAVEEARRLSGLTVAVYTAKVPLFRCTDVTVPIYLYIYINLAVEKSRWPHHIRANEDHRFEID